MSDNIFAVLVQMTDVLPPSTHTPTRPNRGKTSWPPCTFRPIRHSDLPLLGFVRHQLSATCRREETPAPKQKIASTRTTQPDVNILPLHFHTACCIIPLTESWMKSFKVSAQSHSRAVPVPTPRSPAALQPE